LCKMRWKSNIVYVNQSEDNKLEEINDSLNDTNVLDV